MNRVSFQRSVISVGCPVQSWNSTRSSMLIWVAGPAPRFLLLRVAGSSWDILALFWLSTAVFGRLVLEQNTARLWSFAVSQLCDLAVAPKPLWASLSSSAKSEPSRLRISTSYQSFCSFSVSSSLWEDRGCWPHPSLLPGNRLLAFSAGAWSVRMAMPSSWVSV